VATQLDGVQIHPRAFLRRLHKATDEAGLPRVNLHELRHTNITAALQAGVAVHVVSRRVGHSKVSTTLDTYARHIPSADDLAAETIGHLLEVPKWSPNGHQSAEMVTR
jgi:integrase